MNLSNRLAGMMRRRGIQSQSQLARLCGVSQSSIHRILSFDTYAPTLDTLQKLAQALDTSVAWLADGAAGQPSPARLSADAIKAIALVHRLPDARQQSVWLRLSQLAEAAGQEDTHAKPLPALGHCVRRHRPGSNVD